MTQQPFYHRPVMFAEVMAWLRPRAGGAYMDGTLGGGGHAEGILAAAGGNATLYGIDRDPAAVAAATERLKSFPGFHALHGNFHDAKALLAAAGAPSLAGALLDLGVSSYQLDNAARGFSYHEDAPLDMRMDSSRGETAAQYLARVTPEEFRRVLTDYGEENWAARIAQVFAEKRREKPVRTTLDLVAVVDAAIPKAVRRKDEGHPARRTFQAVRIAVNDELAPLDRALCDIADLLAPEGRLAVITFHSLEDRIVKNTFRRLQYPCTCPPKAPICTCGKQPLGKVLGGGAVKPSEEETQENPRARSAKLRIFEKR
jgi:16S rRNA (cytosine1402-N4)-methyltransferase